MRCRPPAPRCTWRGRCAAARSAPARLDILVEAAGHINFGKEMHDRKGLIGAVRAVRALSPKAVIPIHLGLAPRSPLLRTSQSPEGFRKRIQDAGLKAEVTVLREGESWEC